MRSVAFVLFVFTLTANAVAAPFFTPLTAEKEENMKTPFTLVPYKQLNARQKENHNFHKVAAALADYGYNSIRLSDDWKGADFIAVHIDGETMLRVQLKGRFGFDKKYQGKNLWIVFRDAKTEEIYAYRHDDLLPHYIKRFEQTAAWRNKGTYHFPSVPEEDKKRLGKKLHRIYPPQPQ